jgi:hypothetical protein
MSDNDENANSQPAAPEPAQPIKLQDLALDLNFVPNWARKSSAEITTFEERGRSGGGRRDDRNDRGPRARRDAPCGGSGGGGGARSGDQRSQGPRRDERRDSGDKRSGGDQRGLGRPPHRDDQNNRRPPVEERIYLPIDISFIPDRDRLGAVVRQLHTVRRAFPLPYLAGLFLTKPEHHMIKLEVRQPKDGQAPLVLFQCKETRAIFLSREELVSYLVKNFLDRYFERVEVAMEPPVGNFVCVGQCKRTGTLLGPPNYHGYNERLMDVYRTHFPQMSIDQYRNNIEMIRDPAVIEQWKESCRTQVRYRPKDTPEAEATLTLTEAENQFIEKFAATMIISGSKAILPASAIAKMTDEKLRYVLQSAWMREDRFPLSLMLALRPAFRRMRLHLFKAGKDDTYVTTIPPKALDAEHAIPAIKDMVTLISEHPGCNKKLIVEKLYPGKAIDDPEVVQKLEPLIWLIDKGHIIEFFNGTYAIPGHLRNPNAAPSEKPQEHHHPEVKPEDVPAVAVTVPTNEELATEAETEPIAQDESTQASS